jgi:hypothetical protein
MIQNFAKTLRKRIIKKTSPRLQTSATLPWVSDIISFCQHLTKGICVTGEDSPAGSRG